MHESKQRNIAIIDDDSLQVLILQELSVHAELDFDVVFHHFTTVEVFRAARDPGEYCAVMLDNRLPPHRNYSASLDVLSETVFDGPVLLISAAQSERPHTQTRFVLHGPVEKLEFSNPKSIRSHLNQLFAIN